MDMEASFGEVLKTLRNRKRLSRPKLALKLGVHPRTLENWERGDVLPDRARVDELIRALVASEAETLLLLEAHAGRRILPSLHNLPAAQNPYFTGREEILAQLHHRLGPGSQMALTQAISGLGGIGKTQVALEYVYRYRKAYSHVLWIIADSPETLVIEVGRLARDLDLPEKKEKDRDKVVRAVQRWLREYLDWLLILDNIEDLGLVRAFVPADYLGAVLLTTRLQVTEPVAQALELDVFSEDDGVSFLLKRARRLAPDEASAEEVMIARTITQQLGGLPLALDQTGAYIVENRCSLSHYLDLFKQRQAALLQRRGTVPGDHPQSVTTTFSLAFEKVQQKNEAAIELLYLCGHLAPDAIPLELITLGAIHLGIILEKTAADTLQLDQALETLLAYSLVRRDGESRTLSIHRLVQAVLEDAIDEPTRILWAERAVRAVNHVSSASNLTAWQDLQRWFPQAQACTKLIIRWRLSFFDAIQLLNRTGRYLIQFNQHEEALGIFAWAIQFGSNNAELWTGKGYALRMLYRYEEALEAFKQAFQLDPNFAFAYVGRGITLR